MQPTPLLPDTLRDYKERVTYDPNGNIKTYNRKGNTARFSPFLLTEAISIKVKYLGETGQKVIERNPYEPWRQFISLMICQLDATISENFADSFTFYKSGKPLEEDLKLLREVLTNNGLTSLADDILFSVERTVKCFGFHLAKLDIRQNSAFHDKAITQILIAIGEKDYDFKTGMKINGCFFKSTVRK